MFMYLSGYQGGGVNETKVTKCKKDTTIKTSASCLSKNHKQITWYEFEINRKFRILFYIA